MIIEEQLSWLTIEHVEHDIKFTESTNIYAFVQNKLLEHNDFSLDAFDIDNINVISLRHFSGLILHRDQRQWWVNLGMIGFRSSIVEATI